MKPKVYDWASKTPVWKELSKRASEIHEELKELESKPKTYDINSPDIGRKAALRDELSKLNNHIDNYVRTHRQVDEPEAVKLAIDAKEESLKDYELESTRRGVTRPVELEDFEKNYPSAKKIREIKKDKQRKVVFYSHKHGAVSAHAVKGETIIASAAYTPDEIKMITSSLSGAKERALDGLLAEIYKTGEGPSSNNLLKAGHNFLVKLDSEGIEQKIKNLYKTGKAGKLWSKVPFIGAGVGAVAALRSGDSQAALDEAIGLADPTGLLQPEVMASGELPKDEQKKKEQYNKGKSMNYYSYFKNKSPEEIDDFIEILDRKGDKVKLRAALKAKKDMGKAQEEAKKPLNPNLVEKDMERLKKATDIVNSRRPQSEESDLRKEVMGEAEKAFPSPKPDPRIKKAEPPEAPSSLMDYTKGKIDTTKGFEGLDEDEPEVDPTSEKDIEEFIKRSRKKTGN